MVVIQLSVTLPYNGWIKELKVWEKAVDLAVRVYGLTENLPSQERFGLSSQMQRASVAISSNIAEGYRRNGRKEFRQFCSIALGSAAELETQLMISNQIYPKIDTKEITNLCIEVQKMLNSLISKL